MNSRGDRGGWTVTAFMIVVSAVAWLAAGCDDSASTPPVEILEEQQREEQTKAALEDIPPPPTTQELVSGAYKSLTLPAMPLSVYVPESWNIETFNAGSINLLVGHAPGGEVRINLSHHPRTTQDKIDIMVNGARKEMEKDPKYIKKVEMKDSGAGQMKVLERQSLSRSAPLPDPINPDADLGPIMRWTITYFVPSGDEFETYELNFITLSTKQFEKDQEFLRKIIDSVMVDASSASPPPSQSPSPAVETQLEPLPESDQKIESNTVDGVDVDGVLPPPPQ